MLDVVSLDAVAAKRSRSSEPERQIHPIGSLISVDDGWRKRLTDELERQGMSQRELARRVGVTAGTISNLVTGRHTQARKTVIAAIHAVLRWIAPTETTMSDEAYRRIVDGALEISPQDRETVARLIESLKAAR